MKILITGVSGYLGRLVAKEMATDHEVIGIDRRPWPDAPPSVRIHQIDIRKRAAEDVFRKERPNVAIHLATVTHLTSRSEERYRINLEGTRALFDHCNHYGVSRAVFIGRHTYYGASHDSPLYHSEDDPPMAANSFPELADLVAADLYAGSALWRYPKLETAVLRFCYLLGPGGGGTLANFIRPKRVPTILGFDPLFQFIHENDVAKAIARTASIDLNRGVFNVAGPPPLPLSTIIEHAGKERLPLPEKLFRMGLKRMGLPVLPTGALAHLKYPVTIDDQRFRDSTGFTYAHSEYQTIADYSRAP